MEISKTLQADIMNIQKQLKLAIQNHQIMVLKQKIDPLNVQIKKEIEELQKHIMSLGENQKHLVQRLRKELDACSNNNALGAKTKSLSLGLVATGRTTVHAAHKNNSSNITSNNNNISTTNNNNSSSKNRDVYIEKQHNTNHKIIRSRPASVVSSSGSEDSQGLLETCDSRMADKVEFLSAVGLVTREVLSELQNRRVERKRRSTANHTQFIYGSNWDVSKRKKNSYLVTGSAPNQHATRQMTRAQRTEPPDPPVLSKPTTIRSRTPETCNVPVPQTTTRTLIPADNNTPGSLRIAGLPESLTIERISSPQQVCVICRKIGELAVCSNCSTNFHSACIQDWPGCPQCNMKLGQNSSSNCKVMLQSYIGSHKGDIEERKAEKHRLKQLTSQLMAEKEQMEQRATELTVSLASQDVHKKDLLQKEEAMRKKIQRLHDFVTIIKTPRSATPS